MEAHALAERLRNEQIAQDAEAVQLQEVEARALAERLMKEQVSRDAQAGQLQEAEAQALAKRLRNDVTSMMPLRLGDQQQKHHIC